METTRTVLVVDDDEMTRLILRVLLEKEPGHRILFAENGDDALAIASLTPPDVVLLDIVMPGLDGFDVCRHLRAHPVLRHVPIILLTGLAGREFRLRGLEAGADEFLNKPVDLIELRTRIRTITQLNRFRRLCDEQARFEAAIAHSPDGIVLTDGSGLIQTSNAAFVQLVGPPPSCILECFSAATAATLRARLASLGGTDHRFATFEAALQLSVQPGSFAEVTVVRLPWSDGTLLEFTFRDTTDRKQLEQQLLRSQRIELLGQLAGGVVHDVNNLLMTVTLNAECIEACAAPDIAQRAGVIRQNAERGAALLRQILMFARGTEPALTPVQIGSVLEETGVIATELIGRNITLTVEVAPDLPEVRGEPNQLQQVFLNLCINARDAMPGGGRLSLAARSAHLSHHEAKALSVDASPGEFVIVEVRDNGAGIPPEVHHCVFDPFFTTKPRETATGLGLAIAQRVMRHHHGFIGFQSQSGAGTCFTCLFPALSARR